MIILLWISHTTKQHKTEYFNTRNTVRNTVITYWHRRHTCHLKQTNKQKVITSHFMPSVSFSNCACQLHGLVSSEVTKSGLILFCHIKLFWFFVVHLVRWW